MSRTIGFLGLLASIVALASLIFSAFHEPLYPYMLGIMGGFVEAYRTMRDALFSGLGWILLALINWAGNWLDWLPPTPWFHFSNAAKDAFTFYCLIAAAMLRVLYRHWGNNPWHWQGKSFWAWWENFLLSLLFPILIILSLFPLGKNVRDRIGASSIKLAMVELGKALLGTLVFFFFVVAENRIGL
ncbi:hypothetical protein [Hyphococcus sp.]|uniref:hypothetical protein n=1 Tax=Hyphococcus sp. TaxID=2038636 RepID=UPI003D10EFB2